MRKIFFFLFFISSLKSFSQGKYYVAFNYGIASPINTWIGDIYQYPNLYEIYPETRFQASLRIGKTIPIKKNEISINLGVRTERLSSIQRFQNQRSTSTVNSNSVLLGTSFIKNSKINDYLNFFVELGVNLQFNNLFSNSEGINLVNIRNTTLSVVNGDTVQNYKVEARLRKDNSYSVLPQGKFCVGLQTKTSDRNNLGVYLTIESDLLKADYLSYSFYYNDRKSNQTSILTSETRKIRRLYFSLGIAYLFAM